MYQIPLRDVRFIIQMLTFLSHHHYFLLFLFISLFILPSSQYDISPLQNDDRMNQINHTIYLASKTFCFGCIGESLEFLFYHNMVRAIHFEFPLIWDFSLENYARWWAAQRRQDCELRHSFPEGSFTYGENIFWGSGSAWGPRDAVTAWAAEVRYYSYATNACQKNETCGHYTQIVWKNTRRVGCARVVCDEGDIFMTCNYDPPGNYVGERPY